MRLTNTDGSGTFVESPTDATHLSAASWSPDGTKIAFVSYDGAMRVEAADASGTGVNIPVPAGVFSPEEPRWSPDGTRLAFYARVNSTTDRVFVAKADGTQMAFAAVPSTPYSTKDADWKPNPALQPPPPPPPPPPPGPTGPGGPTTGGPGMPSPPGGTTPAPTRPQVTIAFASFRFPPLSPGDLFVPIASVNCNAQGARTYPPSKYCQYRGQAKWQTTATVSAKKKKRVRTIVFATGTKTVALGKKGTLSLKLTKAARRALKTGRRFKITVTVKQTRAGRPAGTTTRTLTLTVKRKRKR